uniref:Putative secreted protein n=1 Tax=Anopheles triannulatus TaxID=58253 RepID=A0A2M4B386_9DIPT
MTVVVVVLVFLWRGVPLSNAASSSWLRRLAALIRSGQICWLFCATHSRSPIRVSNLNHSRRVRSASRDLADGCWHETKWMYHLRQAHCTESSRPIGLLRHRSARPHSAVRCSLVPVHP